jgi:hypothetical protein
MSEFEFEPVRGLPAALPPGEKLLWQGSPTWRSTAARVLHVRTVSIYFAAVIVLRIAGGLYLGQSAHDIGTSLLWLAGLGAATIGFLLWVARMIADGTVYTVTSRRIVMRFGMVVPISINIPFAAIRSAALKTYPDGTGDIPVSLDGNGRIAYPHLWPHARPWSVRNPEPMLRGIPQARSAAEVLAHALKEAAV